MKRIRRVLSVLLTAVLLFSGILFMSVSSTGIGILPINDNQCGFRFHLNGGTSKTGLFIYDFESGLTEYLELDQIPQDFAVLPYKDDTFLEGSLVTLPSVQPPMGYSFVGWRRCPVDENDSNSNIYTNIPGGYCVQAADLGRLVEFSAVYEAGEAPTTVRLKIEQVEPVQICDVIYDIQDKSLYLVFTTDHFSLYVIVDESAPAHTHIPGAVVKENEVKASCKAAGRYDEVIYCSECKEEIGRKTIQTDMLEHHDDDNDGKCDACGEKMTGGNHCGYCGKIHGGAFGWLIKFFHTILAFFKR